MSFTREEIEAAGRLIDSGMTGGLMAPGMEAKAEKPPTIAVTMNRMLGEAEEVAIGPLRLTLHPLSMREMRREFWPLAVRLPFFDAALSGDGPGVDFAAMSHTAKEGGIDLSAATLSRQWALMQQDEATLWLLCEIVALMLVDTGTTPIWPRPEPAPLPEDDEGKTAWAEALDAPAPEDRRWLDDAIDELEIGEWCDLLRAMIEVNAGFVRTAVPFGQAANL